RARMTDLCQGVPEVRVEVSVDSAVTAATRWDDGRFVVEVAEGFLKPFARKGPSRKLPGGRSEAAAAPRTTELPSAVRVMLAHEASHVLERDPEIMTRLLADVCAAALLAFAVVPVDLASSGIDESVVALRTAPAGALLVFGWFMLMMGRELQADLHALRIEG